MSRCPPRGFASFSTSKVEKGEAQGKDMTTRSGSSRPDLDTGQWKRIRAAVRRRDGNVCVVCGRRDWLSVHHVVPARLGGSDEMDNLVTVACCIIDKRVRSWAHGRSEAHARALRRRPGARHLLGSTGPGREADSLVSALVRLATRRARAAEQIVASPEEPVWASVRECHQSGTAGGAGRSAYRFVGDSPLSMRSTAKSRCRPLRPFSSASRLSRKLTPGPATRS